MVVGCTRLSAEFSVTVVAHIAPKALRCTARLLHTALQQLLHQEGTLVRNHLLFCRRTFVYHLSVVVHNLGYQYWVVVLTIVCNGTVGTGHLQQVHIAGTQGKGWCVIQWTVDTHLLGGFDDALDAHLLSQAYCHGVDTLGEGTLQWDTVTRE